MENSPSTPPVNDPASSRPGRWFLAIFLTGIAIFALRIVILYYRNPAYEMTAYNLGSATGSLTFTVILPGAIAIFWWRARKFDYTRAKEPLIAYAVLTALFAFSSLNRAWREAGPPQATPYLYRPSQCEFSVVFPAPPYTAQVNAESLELTNEKELGTENALLRAGCLRLERTELRKKEVLIDFLTDLGSKMELQDTVMNTFIEGQAVVGSVRGKKSVNDNEHMMESRWYVGNSSVMFLTTVASLEGYPAADVVRFQESVKYQESGNVD